MFLLLFLLAATSSSAHATTATLYETLLLAERDSRNDAPEALVDDYRFENLRDIEQAGLMKATLDESPWSDDYWPLARGAAARRYADEDFPDSENWKENYSYFKKTTNASSLDDLSPAEKYDLLVGDSEQRLTHAMWDEGKAYYERYNTVERWMGLCHGWAAASYMLPRPLAAVEALAADGKTKIRFFPADIKALATLLWSKAPGEVRHAGGRCNTKGPDADENGRVGEKDCFDTNPSTWHLSVVNQLGAGRRSLVFDATYDYQVWNQPLYSYAYSYFNVKTGKPADSLKSAVVKIGDYKKDPYKTYRSPKAAYVVGINMSVTYVSETYPTHALIDDPSHDVTHDVEYVYDLELDRSGRVIGGEWHSKAHPDFIWTPTRDARALTVGDHYLKRMEEREPSRGWDGSEPLPDQWRMVAQRISSRGLPLARIVEALIVISRVGT